MAWVFSPGKMAESMKVNIKTIRNTVWDSTCGLMVANTTGNGKMVSSTATELIDSKMDKRDKACGKKVRDFTGQMKVPVKLQ